MLHLTLEMNLKKLLNDQKLITNIFCSASFRFSQFFEKKIVCLFTPKLKHIFYTKYVKT